MMWYIGVLKQLCCINVVEYFLNIKMSCKSQMFNFGKFEDIVDYMVGGEGDGYVIDVISGSELDMDVEVEVVDNVLCKVMLMKVCQVVVESGEVEVEQEDNVECCVVKLVEFGFCMCLCFIKVEDGFCFGKVMWYEYIYKSKEEVKEFEKCWEQKRWEKEVRKKEQKVNVEWKKVEKDVQKGKKGGDEGDEEEDDDEEDYSDMDVDDFDSEGFGGDVEFQVNE